MSRPKKQKNTGYNRLCHDCRKPTNNYRCEACWRKFKIKHGILNARGVDDE